MREARLGSVGRGRRQHEYPVDQAAHHDGEDRHLHRDQVVRLQQRRLGLRRRHQAGADWSSANADTGSIALKAVDEADTYAWKRFYSANATDQDKIPTLDVTYNYRPSNGTNLQAGAPFISSGGIFKVNTTTPTLRFSTSDTNGEDEVTGTYEITDTSTGSVVTTINAAAVPSQSTSQVKVRPASSSPARRTASAPPPTTAPTTPTAGPTRSASPSTPPGRRRLPRTPSAWPTPTPMPRTSPPRRRPTPPTPRSPRRGERRLRPLGRPEQRHQHPERVDAEQADHPQGGTQGTQVGGNVVYTTSGPVDTVVQPTVDGGSRTLNILKNSSARRTTRPASPSPPE